MFLWFHSYEADSKAVERGLTIAPTCHLAAHNNNKLYLKSWQASEGKAGEKKEKEKEKKEVESMQTGGRQLGSFYKGGTDSTSTSQTGALKGT